MRAPGGAHRAWAQGQDQSEIGVRPEELFLSGSAAGLPDQPVQIADRRRGRSRGRHARRRDRARRHRAAASGAGRRQVAARPAPVDVARRSQPLRRGADGDRVEARSALGRRGQGLCREAARHPALSRHLRRRHGEGQSARRRQRLGAQARRALGTRCEIKNVNSIRFIGQAIEHEARRQIEIIEDGGTIEQETRLFDPDKGETRSMRSKEEAHDYRYFPDPDLLPLELSPSLVEDLRQNLPELPDEKKARFMRDYALSAYDADVLVAERETAEYFETVVKGGARGAIQDRRQLGDQRADRPPQQGRQGHRRLAGLRGAARRDPRSDRRRHNFRQDRQGRVRDRLDRGRRAARRSSKSAA